MEITREDVKKWMEKYHHSIEWLAGKRGVSKRTVSNWLTDTTKPIPKKQMAEIAKLIKSQNDPKNCIVIWLSDDDFRKVNRKAFKAGVEILEWAEARLLEDENLKIQGKTNKG